MFLFDKQQSRPSPRNKKHFKKVLSSSLLKVTARHWEVIGEMMLSFHKIASINEQLSTNSQFRIDALYLPCNEFKPFRCGSPSLTSTSSPHTYMNFPSRKFPKQIINCNKLILTHSHNHLSTYERWQTTSATAEQRQEAKRNAEKILWRRLAAHISLWLCAHSVRDLRTSHAFTQSVAALFYEITFSFFGVVVVGRLCALCTCVSCLLRNTERDFHSRERCVWVRTPTPRWCVDGNRWVKEKRTCVFSFFNCAFIRNGLIFKF